MIRGVLHYCMTNRCAACGDKSQLSPAQRRGLRWATDLKDVGFCWACYYDYAIRMGLHRTKGGEFAINRPDILRQRTIEQMTDQNLKQWFNGFNHSARARIRPGATFVPLALEFYVDLLASQEYRCAMTGKSTQLALDHIVPLAEGGDHTPENLRFIDVELNQAKGAAMLNPNPLDRSQETGVVRVTANGRALTWFTRLSARERGRLIEELYNHR